MTLRLPSVQVISYTKDSIVVGEKFKGRAGFLNAMPSPNVSLYVNNTQESDSGRYLCQVVSPNGTPNGELRLDVQGENKHTLLHHGYTIRAP